MIDLIANALGRVVVGRRHVEYSPGDKDSGTTLGRLRRSKGCSLLVGAEIAVWSPCWTPTTSKAIGFADDLRDDRGRLVPHVFYARTIGAGCQSIACEPCRVAIAARHLARYGGAVLRCEHCDLDHRHVGGSASPAAAAATPPPRTRTTPTKPPITDDDADDDSPF